MLHVQLTVGVLAERGRRVCPKEGPRHIGRSYAAQTMPAALQSRVLCERNCASGAIPDVKSWRDVDLRSTLG